jgi:hypothetical protein
MPVAPAGADRRRRRWGGLGPFLIKVEEPEGEEFVEEVVEPPVRVPAPVSTLPTLMVSPRSWM